MTSSTDRKSTIFYYSFYDAIKDLPAQNQLEVYNAIFEYTFKKITPELSGVSNTIFKLIKPQLDANQVKFQNGKKGGRPKEKGKIETKPKPKQNLNETKPKANVNVNVNVNENKKEKEKIYKKEKIDSEKAKAFAKENNLDEKKVLAEIPKCEDWYRGKGKGVKDWNATFRNWLRNEKMGGLARYQKQENNSLIGKSIEELYG